MTRYRARAVQGFMARHRHAETCAEYHAPVVHISAPPNRAVSLARKAELESAGADLALRISVWNDQAATVAFEEVRAELKVIERDLAFAIPASAP